MKRAASTFVAQQEQSDCGVACLASIHKYHGGSSSLEQLRELSGTSKDGTTLLGLLQAAEKLGFIAEGLEAEGVHNLSELTEPAILHVVVENRLQHYVVYYPDSSVKKDTYTIGDPSKGVIEMTSGSLDALWKSKALLRISATERVQQSSATQTKKKNWLLSLVETDLPILLISLVLGIIITVLGLTTAIFSQQLIDDILPKENIRKLELSLAFVFLLLIARSGLSYIRGLFMIRQGVDFNSRIIQSFYSNLLALPKSFFDTRKIGELIARMNDTHRIQTVLATITGSILIDLLLLVVSLVFVFTYSAYIGVVMLISLPFYFFILFVFNSPIQKAQKEVMSGYALSESNFIETMQGVADIKLMNKQSFFEKINATLYNSFQDKIRRLGKLNISFNLASEVTGAFFNVLVFGIAALLTLTHELKFGQMVALLAMTSNLIPAATRIVIANIQMQEALVAFDRMFEFTSLDKEENDSNSIAMDEMIKKLELSDVSFRFPGRRQILHNVSMDFQRGEMVALIGESGGGKSTLLQLIEKFYNPEAGMILVNDRDLTSISSNYWRSQIGTVRQDLKVFNGSLIYNIILNDSKEEIEKAYGFCEEKGFSKYFNEFPQGYLTMLGEEGVNISGGQMQLVALARALYRQPQVLLLDETTSAMDRKMENFVLTLLHREKKNMIIVFVTHRISAAGGCDKIAVLENGTVVTKGTADSLLETDNYFSVLYHG